MVLPSGDTSSEIHVPSSVVNRRVRSGSRTRAFAVSVGSGVDSCAKVVAGTNAANMAQCVMSDRKVKLLSSAEILYGTVSEKTEIHKRQEYDTTVRSFKSCKSVDRPEVSCGWLQSDLRIERSQ